MSGKYNTKNVCCYIDLAKGKRGLGPDFLGEVRHRLPYHISYHQAARFHDLGYELALIPQQQIDEKFYQIMLKEKPTKWATFYYILCRGLGRWFYKK